MAVPAHQLLVFKGVFGDRTAPAEEWQFGLKATRDEPVDSFNEAQMVALAEALGDAWNANMAPITPDEIHLTETRWVLVGANGLTERRADGSYKQGVESQLGDGALSGGIIFPPQTALVASLETVRGGPTGKGRIFLPYPATQLNGSYQIPEADAQVVANAVSELISDINAIGGGVVSVFSSKGYSTPVSGVRVGRVLDTMRSRRGRAIEGYVQATVAITQ